MIDWINSCWYCASRWLSRKGLPLPYAFHKSRLVDRRLTTFLAFCQRMARYFLSHEIEDWGRTLILDSLMRRPDTPSPSPGWFAGGRLDTPLPSLKTGSLETAQMSWICCSRQNLLPVLWLKRGHHMPMFFYSQALFRLSNDNRRTGENLLRGGEKREVSGAVRGRNFLRAAPPG
jgi:hypothetical protein